MRPWPLLALAIVPLLAEACSGGQPAQPEARRGEDAGVDGLSDANAPAESGDQDAGPAVVCPAPSSMGTISLSELPTGPCSGTGTCPYDVRAFSCGLVVDGYECTCVANAWSCIDTLPGSGVPPPASLIVANTAPGIPPFRLCLATESAASLTVTAIAPLPDGPSTSPAYPTTGPYPGVSAGTPGIYPGAIGAFPTITDLSTLTITPFAVLASSIANDINFDGGAGVNATDGGVEETCVQLIGSHGLGPSDTGAGSTPGRLTPGTDYFRLASIPANTLLDCGKYLLTIDGCLPGGSTPGLASGVPETQTCGPTYDGGNSASLGIAQIDWATQIPSGEVGVQFAHRSTALENTPSNSPATDGVWPAFLQREELDAGPDAAPGVSYVTTLIDAAAGPVKYSGSGIAPSPVQVLPLDVSEPGTTFGVLVQPLDGGAPNASPWPGTPGSPGDLIALPLAEIFALSRWDLTTAQTPSGFAPGQSYTFLLVGDPAAQPLTTIGEDGGVTQNPLYDGRGVHIVAFPNSFTPRVFQ
jgi:hypothetical protein